MGTGRETTTIITMSRCTGCGAIEDAGARSHTCVPGRDEWGQRAWSLDKNSPTELVTFALMEGSKGHTMAERVDPAHCTRHSRHEPGCVWCYSAAVSYAAATRTFPEPSDPLLPEDYSPEDYSPEDGGA